MRFWMIEIVGIVFTESLHTETNCIDTYRYTANLQNQVSYCSGVEEIRK
jgi:hypothetical protein